MVFEYIQKFGGVVISNQVLYSRYSEGPFKGKYNGERKYQVDFTNSTRSMGTYHWLDGSRVRIFYRGNEKTCGRCHKSPRTCPGGAIARDCQEAGGERTNLSDHMKQIWQEIGFNPTSFELPSNGESGAVTQDKSFLDSNHFRKKHNVQATESDEKRYVGLNIANFSLDIDDNSIREFVKEYVSNEIEDETIEIVREKKKSCSDNHALSSPGNN